MSISRAELEALAKDRGEARFSIYMPTHRRGPETEQDAIRFRNLLAEAQRRIDDMPDDREPLSAALEALRALELDREFWRHQAEGLALLAKADGVRAIRLPFAVEELVFVGDRFCLRPLLPAVADPGRFHVLALSQKQVRLLECTRSAARELDARDIPDSLADALGYDWEQESLQFHTGAAPTGSGGAPRAAVYHGHGGGTDDAAQKEEVRQFLHRVDDGVNRLLAGERVPLVLAAVEREATMFRGLSHHPMVIESFVAGSPEHKSIDDLHAAALELVRPVLDAREDALRERMRQAAHSDLYRAGLEHILPAAAEGRAETVMLAECKPVWGTFDEATGAIEVHAERRPGDDDLLDLAMALAVGTGAEVLAAEDHTVPSGASPEGAAHAGTAGVLLRYSPSR